MTSYHTSNHLLSVKHLAVILKQPSVLWGLRFGSRAMGSFECGCVALTFFTCAISQADRGLWLRQTRKSRRRKWPQTHFAEPQPAVTLCSTTGGSHTGGRDSRPMPRATYSHSLTGQHWSGWGLKDNELHLIRLLRTLISPGLCPLRFWCIKFNPKGSGVLTSSCGSIPPFSPIKSPLTCSLCSPNSWVSPILHYSALWTRSVETCQFSKLYDFLFDYESLKISS